MFRIFSFIFGAMKKQTLLLLSFLCLVFLFSCKKRVNGCFDFSPTNPVLTDTITFDAGCSENATSYKWSFGDGTPDTTTTTPTITHVFPSSGLYRVYLNVDGEKSKLLKSHTQMQRDVLVQ